MAETKEKVTVEFYGVPRLRAGRASVIVPGNNVSEVLSAIEEACPGLTGLVQPHGRLAPHYMLSINGHRFVDELQEQVRAGDRIILLSADAGG